MQFIPADTPYEHINIMLIRDFYGRKKWKISDENVIFFLFLAQTWIVGSNGAEIKKEIT